MLIISFLYAALAVTPVAVPAAPERVHVRMVTDEADAVLGILAKRKAGKAVADADWQKLFRSEGYQRLMKREAAMKRPFTDDDFRKFVLSDALAADEPRLRQTLAEWKRTEIGRPAQMALAYLPSTAQIHATIYPEIKPHTNSFVFEVESGNPAIILYLDPKVGRPEFENTVAHELHHIGYGSGCPSASVEARIKQQPEPVRRLAKWVGAFGEGFAMLAAAGGADRHPHATGPVEDRARWDRDVADFAKNQQELNAFFLKVVRGELNSEQTDKQAYEYFGVQGPWYTVGWQMAVTIEKAEGRARLIEVMCNSTEIFAAYNAAVRKAGNDEKRLWSEELIDAVKPIADESGVSRP